MKAATWRALGQLLELGDEDAIRAVREVVREARGTALLAEALAARRSRAAALAIGVRVWEFGGYLGEPGPAGSRQGGPKILQ